MDLESGGRKSKARSSDKREVCQMGRKSFALTGCSILDGLSPLKSLASHKPVLSSQLSLDSKFQISRKGCGAREHWRVTVSASIFSMGCPGVCHFSGVVPSSAFSQPPCPGGRMLLGSPALPIPVVHSPCAVV